MITVTAPSNIALIKYMGKSQVEGNRPTNSSLSYTLNHLVTSIEITPTQMNEAHEKSDVLKAKSDQEFPLILSEKGERRFLDFFKFLKNEFGVHGFFEIKSGNNFPSDCGLASSASSFAALTKGTHELALSQGSLRQSFSNEALAKISQKGSGSSCRSFFSPFSIWNEEGAKEIDLGIDHLHHVVLILEDRKKLVSSSQAHVQVLSSQLFNGRVERAESRLKDLIHSLKIKDWKTSYQICWEEFWDMHALFETSRPSFGYLNAEAMTALQLLRDYWQRTDDGPIITMDAGPNIHLLFRPDQTQVKTEVLELLKHKISDLKVISS